VCKYFGLSCKESTKINVRICGEIVHIVSIFLLTELWRIPVAAGEEDDAIFDKSRKFFLFTKAARNNKKERGKCCDKSRVSALDYVIEISTNSRRVRQF
jgi:hypothetical protein